MITLLLGDFGHGKSTYILNQIKTDCQSGVPSFLIVPEQQTVLSERQIATLLPPSAQLYTDATNFTRLANRVFRELGGLKYNYITKSGKNLIMYRAICEVRESLREYKIPKGHERGCISLFLDAIGELKSYSVTLDMLEGIVYDIENEHLRARISDIIAVWSVYERIMGERFSDPYDDILMLNKKLGEFNYFDQKNVYIDSFYGFTKSQLDIIEKIILGAKNVTVAFDCPLSALAGEMQYAKIAKSANDIIKICRRNGKEYKTLELKDDRLHRSKAIAHIASSLWRFDASPIPASNDVSLMIAEDEFDECEAVASKISELIYSGARYSDIAIIARNSATYRGIIDYTLKKYDIPSFYSTPSPLLSRPVVKMIFCALNAISSYQGEDVISYAKCGYLPLSEEEICDFESYVYRWNIYGHKFKNEDYWLANPDGYIKLDTDRQRKTLENVANARDKILRLLDILEKPFASSLPVRECAGAIYDFLCAHSIKERLEEEIKASSKDEAYIICQVWEAIIKTLDTVVDICGDSVVDARTFSTLFSYAFLDCELGTIPTGEDRVLIADADAVRAQGIKHVFVLGANEGVFPASLSDGSFFNDSDKITLETYGITLSYSKDVRADDELMFFKNSIAIASDTAVISALSSDISGTAKEPSVAFERIKKLFTGLTVELVSDKNPIDRIYTPENARELYSSSPDSLKKAIFELTGNSYERADFRNDRESISKETADRLFTSTLRLSPSRIESYQRCKFSYFTSYVLNLRSEKKIKFASRELGTLVHAVFEYFLKKFADGELDFATLENQNIKELIDKITKEYIDSICENTVATSRLSHFFERVKLNIYVFVKNLIDEFKESEFVPEYFELSFSEGKEGSPRPLTVSVGEGKRVIVGGVADRVDVLRRDSRVYVRVVDYKTGNKEFSMADFNNGIGMQMFIYLFALWKMEDCDFKRRLLKDASELLPAGALYLPLNIGKARVSHEIDLESELSLEYESKAVDDAISRNGRLLDDDEIILAQEKGEEKRFLPKKSARSKSYVSLDELEGIYEGMKNTITEIASSMLSGDFSAVPMESGTQSVCDYCESRAFCRRREQ